MPASVNKQRTLQIESLGKGTVGELSRFPVRRADQRAVLGFTNSGEELNLLVVDADLQEHSDGDTALKV